MTGSKPRLLFSEEERQRLNAAMARAGRELRKALDSASEQIAAAMAKPRERP